jgi:hypothetical protein
LRDATFDTGQIQLMGVFPICGLRAYDPFSW